MARSIPVNWRIHIPEPIEVKMVSLTLAVRNAIPNLERFRGLFTYVLEDDTFYYLSEGTSNNHWKPIGKPQAIVIYDEFQDGPQKIISGQGFKNYLLAHYYTKQEVDQRLAGLEISPWIKDITAEQIQKWDSNTGDVSERRNFPDPKFIWAVQHPSGKSCEAFNQEGKSIMGKKTRITETITSFNWSKPIAGYVEIN